MEERVQRKGVQEAEGKKEKTNWRGGRRETHSIIFGHVPRFFGRCLFESGPGESAVRPPTCLMTAVLDER